MLKFNGNLLNDFDKGHVLNAYGFTDGDAITLNVKQQSITFDVEVLGSEIMKNLSFESNIFVLDLKEKLFDRCGLVPKHQILTFEGIVLDDFHSLNHYGISNESLIKLTVQDI